MCNVAVECFALCNSSVQVTNAWASKRFYKAMHCQLARAWTLAIARQPPQALVSHENP